MVAEDKRLTISVTSLMKDKLSVAKKERYCDVSQSEMLRDLIVRGLDALQEEKNRDAGANILNV